MEKLYKIVFYILLFYYIIAFETDRHTQLLLFLKSPPPAFRNFFNSPFWLKTQHTMAPTTAAAPSSPTGSAVRNAQHRKQHAPGGAGKSHTKSPDKALASQTGGDAGDAAATRFEAVSVPPPPCLTKAQTAQRARAAAFSAYLAAAKVDAARRHQLYIRKKAKSDGSTVDEAEKKAQAENAAERALAQKKWGNSHIREPSTNLRVVWADKEEGWITKE